MSLTVPDHRPEPEPDHGPYQDSDIAVVGMAGRFPGSADLAEFWRHCLDGEDRVTRWEPDGVPGDAPGRRVPAGGLLADPDRFDAPFFGLTPHEAELLDPQHRVFLEVAWHAFEDAAVVPGEAERTVSVYAAAAPSRYRISGPVDGLDENERYRRMIANSPDFLATRVAYLLDLRGEAVNVQTACSSSLVAVHLAVQSLRGGLTDVALAGGVSLDPDQGLGYVYQEGMIASPDGRCRPFGAAANGTVPANGAGAVVLQRLGDALAQGRPVHAVIRATATNNDGRAKSSFMAPNVQGQAELIATALALADVPAETIGYFEAHGTGTRLGDPIEIEAVRQAYELFTEQTGFCALGSLKANFGHLDRAAGVAGLIKAVCAVRDGLRPPLAGHEALNPDLDLAATPFRIPQAAEEWTEPVRRAAVSSFGVGGTNAHAIVESFVAEPARPAADRPLALPLSAPDPDGLERHARALAESPDLVAAALADTAHTLTQGRLAHPGARAVIVAADAEQARKSLRAFRAPALQPSAGRSGDAPVVFSFPGQAGRATGHAADLYRAHPVFRAEIDRCAEALELTGTELLEQLLGHGLGDGHGHGDGPATQGNPYQPALVAVEIAYARLLEHLGVRADTYIGSSLGEYAAAHLSGVFERAAVMRLLHTRDTLMRGCEPGAMLTANCAPQDVAELLGERLALAGHNAADRLVLSGGAAEVEAAHRELTARGVNCRVLPGAIAFHSPLMDPILDAYRRAVLAADPRPARAAMPSTLTGSWAEPQEWAAPDYWVRHLREPIRFASAAVSLLEADRLRFCELGPGTALTALVSRATAEGSGRSAELAVAVSAGADDGFEALATALGRLWAHGTPVDWDALNQTADRAFVRLPGHPFAARRFWRHERATAPAAEGLGGFEELSMPVARISPRGALTPAAEPLRVALIVPAAVDRSPSSPAADRSPSPLAAELAARIERAGHQVELLAPGDSPRSPAQHVVDLTLAGLAGGLSAGPEDAAEPAEPEALAGWLERGLLAPARALAAHGTAVRSVHIVTRGLLPVAAGQQPDASAAAVLGLVRCAPHDLPGVTAHLVDLDPTPGLRPEAADDLDALVTEILAPSPEDVALRAGHRYTVRYEPAPADRPSPVRRGGVYLLLGGNGRIGAAAARALSEEAPCTLVLAGRTAGRTPAPEHAAILAQVAALGSTVEELVLDVTDAAAVRAAVAVLVARHGRLDGVLHLAGHTDTSEFRELTDTGPENALAITAAKVRGAAILTEALRGTDCDFVLLYSSISTVLGGFRFGAYAAGNAYLDALAARPRPAQGPVWRSVRWDGWSADGTARPDALGTDAGVRLLRRALRTSAPVLVAAAGDLAARRRRVAAGLADVAGAAGTAAALDGGSVLAAVAATVAEVTGQACADPEQSLTGLGVDSLQMMQIAARLRTALGTQASLAEMLRASTLGALAEVCADGGGTGPAGPAATGPATPAFEPSDALSTMQQRLWYLWQFDPDSNHYNVPFGWRLPQLDEAAARAAVAALLHRHTELRTRYVPGPDGAPLRVTAPVDEVPVETVDLGGADADETQLEAAFQSAALPFVRRPFDLERHAARILIATEPGAVRVLLVCHHVTMDAWSVDILRRDLLALAGGAAPERLALPPADYSDFVGWERSLAADVRERDLAYWQDVIRGLDPSAPVADTAAEGVPGEAAALRRLLPTQLTRQLRRVASEQGTTLYALALTAASVALAEWSGRSEVVVGSNLANRALPEFESVVGMFVDPVVLRLRPHAAGGRLRDAVGHVREVFLGALEHASTPYQDVVNRSGLGGQEQRNPLFSVVVTMFDGEQHPAGADGVTALRLPPPAAVKFDLCIEFLPHPDGLTIHLLYSPARYLRATVERFTTRLAALLTALAEGRDDEPLPAPQTPRIADGNRFARRFALAERAAAAPVTAPAPATVPAPATEPATAPAQTSSVS
ncbi:MULTISPECIES: type I polyketide synthase [Streptomyces]|uniref:type I polyketide synthase n=1 Tax=Streptomyces TaxID=1883 RepID=UPI0004C0159E|nr:MULTISPECIES: type I polyketide synthase [Streptomyces]